MEDTINFKVKSENIFVKKKKKGVKFFINRKITYFHHYHLEEALLVSPTPYSVTPL
jgi:hypothetical protein